MKKKVLKLMKSLSRALRSVLKVDWSFSSSDLFRVLKVDNLSDRRDKHVLHMMYKIAHEMTPGEFLKYFAPKEYHGLRNARKCFEIPKPHTNFKKRALSYMGLKNWNKIPMKIKEMSS